MNRTTLLLESRELDVSRRETETMLLVSLKYRRRWVSGVSPILLKLDLTSVSNINDGSFFKVPNLLTPVFVVQLVHFCYLYSVTPLFYNLVLSYWTAILTP